MSEIKTLVVSDGIPPIVRFWIYLVFNICSIICSLFVLYQFFSIRTLYYALHNHVIIVLLCTGLLKELISIPWTLYRNHVGVALGNTGLFYLFSFFFDYALFTTQLMLVAWATLERHVLIFHDKWLKTKRQRFFFHYFPITAILIYCLIFYSVVIFGSFCKNNFVSYLAGGYIIPCAYTNAILTVWELLVHQLVPTLIITVFSIAIIVRTIRQKQRIHQPIIWRKYRMMTIQMISISVLYLIFNTPWVVTMFIFQNDLAKQRTRVYTAYGLFFRDFIIFAYPFLCFSSCAEIRKKFRCHQQS